MQDEVNKSMSRVALGQIANIGSLYDARRDDFCKISICKKEIPQSALKFVDSHSSDIQFIHSDTFSEKFSKLDVSAELQVSILAGLFKLEGSGRYLKEEKQSAHAVRTSLLYNITTMEENLNIYDENLKDSFAIDSIESGIGTHVVIGISWGANCLLTSEYKCTDNEDRRKIEGSLSAQLKKLSFSISGKAEVDFGDGELGKSKNYELRIFGDILPQNEELPSTYETALDFIKKTPSLIKTSNDGKGKPLKYTLFPISELAKYLSFSIKADSLLKSVDESSIIRVVGVFDEISKVRQELNDFCQKLNDFNICLNSKLIQEFANIKEEFSIGEAKFRSKLSTILVQVRSGHCNSNEIETLIAEFNSGPFSPGKIKSLMDNSRLIKEKIDFTKNILAQGIEYVGFGGVSLDSQIFSLRDIDLYILYFNDDEKSEKIELWEKNIQLFMESKDAHKENAKYFIVDSEAHAMYTQKGIKLMIVRNGKIICDNVLEKHIALGKLCLARCTTLLEKIISKPNKRIPLKIICPSNECSPQEKWKWSCEKCRQEIEYGFDNYFYCSCGRGPCSQFEFKCESDNHGIGFFHFEEEFLLKLLAQMRPMEELNILILGETGVGKSTWINGFVNYINHETLAEAEQNDLISLIPSQFTMCNDNYDEETICTGTSDNEDQTAGHSATQLTKVYPFDFGDTRIRLIDTPGIGDVRGIDKDKENFQNILNTLSYLDNLHGICILLKPNNARLTVMFRFCIKELLTHLHRDASKNIMFCFTNCRGTFYKPGDTLPALKMLLKENKDVEIPISKHTIYCYDSEAFRFLAALKHGMKFDEDERQNFEGSWKKSIDETKRMIEHIKQLTPHPIDSTLSLNNARRLIVQFTKPMSYMSQNIIASIAVGKDKEFEIANCKKSRQDLDALLYIEKTDLDAKKLNHPRTVCVDSSCTQILTIDSVPKVNYTTWCHAHCGLGGILSDTIAPPGLLGCAAMSNGYCTFGTCRHHWTSHMHITYETYQVKKRVIDPNTQKAIDKNLSDEQKIQIFINDTQTRIKEYESELQSIREASAKFGYFLKTNAITPYNDAMDAYLAHLILEEKGKIAVGGSDKVMKGLEETRAAYEQQFIILENQMKENSEGQCVLQPNDIDHMVKELYKLKHFGKELKNIMEVASDSKKMQGEYVEVFSAPSPKKNKKKTTGQKIANFFGFK